MIKLFKEMRKRGKIHRGYILLPILLILSLIGSFYFNNTPPNEVLATSDKIGEEKLKIKKVDSTTYAFKTLDDGLIEIGTEKHSPPQPYLILNKWDGEVSLKVTIPFITQDEPIVEGNKLRYSTIATQNSKNASWWQRIISKSLVIAKENQPQVDIEFYPREPEEITETINGEEHTFTQNEQGGVEFDTILYEKPEQNQIVFPIETKGLKFYYQPPLHPDHPTWVDTDGDGIADSFRPENVVGSYAVYHATRTNVHRSIEEAEKYKTGKAFHIYRPKAVDAEGKEAWCDLHVDEAKGLLTVTIPQEFLDSAVYPVSVDPTFGYETVGASTAGFAELIQGSKYPSGGSGTLDKITAYIEDFYDGYSCAVYDSSLNKVDITEMKAAEFGWTDFNFEDGASISDADYWLLMLSPHLSLQNWAHYDSGEYHQGLEKLQEGWPDVISDPTYFNRKYSIYCTYSPTKDVTVQATVSPWIFLSVSATSTNIQPDLVTETGEVNIGESDYIQITAGTNNSSGYSLDIKSLNAALCHTDGCEIGQISSASSTLQAGQDGYGAQATSSDTDVTIATSYNHATSTNIVGGLETKDNDLADATGPSLSDIIWLTLKAAATSSKPSGTYKDTITLTCTGGL